MHVQTAPDRRQPGLDLLRALAIVVVMLFHKGAYSFTTPGVREVARFGWMGVDLFFVLSGYLIAAQLFRRESFSFGDFYARRAFRILPAYLAVVALYFLLPAFRESPRIQPLWEFLSFTENFRIDYFHVAAFSHVWSLCVEEHFYLVMPLVAFWLLRRPSAKRTAALALGLLLGGMALRAWIWQHQLKPHLADEDTFATLYIMKVYYPTVTRLDGLLAGVLLAAAQAFRPAWWAAAMDRGRALLAAGLGLTAGAVWIFTDRFGLPGTVVGFPLLSLGLALVVAASLSPRVALSRLRVPGAFTLATLAYSLYLTHKAVYHLDKAYLGRWLALGTGESVAVHVATTLAAAALLHLLVERPFMRLRDRVLARRKPEPEPALAS